MQVVADAVEIQPGGSIGSATFSAGDAGRITIEADRLLIRRDHSEFLTGITNSAEPGSSGDAAAVRIVAGELAILAGGEIASSTFSEGDAGRVTVEADRLLIRRRRAGVLHRHLRAAPIQAHPATQRWCGSQPVSWRCLGAR